MCQVFLARSRFLSRCESFFCVGRVTAARMVSERIEFVLISITVKDWSRIVKGLLTQAVLRSFCSDLGGYLKAVKKRGQE